MNEKKETVNDMMLAYSLDAIDFAHNNYKIKLDYSEESILLVEDIIGRLYSSIPKNFLQKIFNKSPSDDEIDQICKMFGGYLGETIRRTKGGKWDFNQTLSPGQLIIELKVRKTSIYPVNKVLKRLTNGAEDNLFSFYKVIIEQL